VLARIYRDLDRSKEANSALEMALIHSKALNLASFRIPEHRVRFAATLGNLSAELTVAGRQEEAEAMIRKALDIWQRLVVERPSEFGYRRGLAIAWTTLGIRQMWWGSTDGKAEATLRHADSLLTDLLHKRPNDVTTRQSLRDSLTNLGVILSWQSRHDEAVKVDRRALSIAEPLAKEFPNDLEAQDSLSIAMRNLVASLHSSGQGSDEELQALNLRAHDVLEKMVTTFPDDVNPKTQYLTSLLDISRMLHSKGKRDSSQQLLERASPLLRDFVKKHSQNQAITSSVGVCLIRLAAGYIEQGDHRRALDAIKAYPSDTTKFNSQLRRPFQIPPDRLAEMRRDFLEEQVYMLLTPEFLLQQCASLAESDQGLEASQRNAAVRELAERSKSFRDQAELAMDAWRKEVYARDDDIAFRVALEAQQRVDERGAAQANTAIPPALRAAYEAAGEEMFRRLVDEANEHLAGIAEQIHLANVLSAAPQELRDPDLAFTLAQQGLEVAPEDPAARQAFGWALFRAGKWQECVDILLEGKEAEADQPRSVLTMALWHIGRRDEARAQFQGAQERLEAYRLAREADKAKGFSALPTASMMRRLHEEAKALLQTLQTESDSNSKR
jgi:tetratricopeptide (TPR) repeat protein